jgi:cold shock CspA family protein
MSKSHQSFNKKEKEKKRRKKKQAKLERRQQRKLEKEQNGPKSFEDMLSYVDENGNLTDTPPDPSKKKKIKAEDIVIGIPPKDASFEEDPVHKGRVKFFNHDKGFGFITNTNSREDLFVHMNNTNDLIHENDQVTFEVEMGAKGPTAVNVSLDK